MHLPPDAHFIAHALQKQGWWHVSVSNSMGFAWHFMHIPTRDFSISKSDDDDEEDMKTERKREKKKLLYRTPTVTHKKEVHRCFDVSVCVCVCFLMIMVVG